MGQVQHKVLMMGEGQAGSIWQDDYFELFLQSCDAEDHPSYDLSSRTTTVFKSTTKGFSEEICL